MSLAPLFRHSKPVIHVGALPGTPANSRSLAEIEKLALREARLYCDAGVDGIMFGLDR